MIVQVVAFYFFSLSESVAVKTIGLLGGMSWESTALYYRLINEETRRRLGGLHSARIAMISVDFQEIEELQEKGDWQKAGKLLADNAFSLQSAGADFMLICTNTMHKVVDQVESAVDIPLLHIADATAECIKASGFSRVGLLGTRFTMDDDFYASRLEAHGIEVLLPDRCDRDYIHRTIYSELCLGVVNDESRQRFVKIINQLHDKGAEGVVEGCTEIAMLVDENHADVPLFDTTRIHAYAAVSVALS